MSMRSPAQLLGMIESVSFEAGQSVRAVWIAHPGDREVLVRELNMVAENLPIVISSVRGHLFENANAVGVDLVEVLEECRGQIEAKDPVIAKHGTVTIVLVSRTELSIPQAASPVLIPGWFPLCAGVTIHVVLKDLMWSAVEPLNGPSSQIGEVSAALFEFERTAVRRLREVEERRPTAAQGLFELLRGRSDHDSLSALLDDAVAARATVQNASAFRPSLRNSSSLTAHLWALGMETAPNRMMAASKQLARALALDEPLLRAHMPLAVVLLRPASPDPSAGRRVARIALATVTMACQLTTAAAHAGDYPAVSSILLQHSVVDLVAALHSLETVVANAPDLDGRGEQGA